MEFSVELSLHLHSLDVLGQIWSHGLQLKHPYIVTVNTLIEILQFFVVGVFLFCFFLNYYYY